MLQQLNVFSDDDIDSAAEALNDGAWFSWKREKDLERECVKAREMKAGPRVGSGTQ